MPFSLKRDAWTKFVLVGVLFAACNDNASQPSLAVHPPGTSSGPGAAGTAGQEGSVLVSTGKNGLAASAFPLNQVLDLNVLIYWKGSSPGQMAQVSFFSPDGQRFRQVQAGPTHSLSTMPGGSVASVVFPVGGTAITAHGLAGKWRVEAKLANGDSSTSGTFELKL